VHFVGLSVVNWLSTVHGMNNIKFILATVWNRVIGPPFLCRPARSLVTVTMTYFDLHFGHGLACLQP
jgi:hypothetical protein